MLWQTPYPENFDLYGVIFVDCVLGCFHFVLGSCTIHLITLIYLY